MIQCETVAWKIEAESKIVKKTDSFIQGSTTSTQSRRQSEAVARESSPEPDFESSGAEDEDEDEEKKEARKARRLAREVKFLNGKLDRLKEKEETARRERQNIRDSMKKNQVVLKWVNVTRLELVF